MTESERTMEDQPEPGLKPAALPTPRLKEALRQARIEIAERTGVIVDLRNAEIAPDVELFDRGLVAGDPPRLWIDMIAHVVMGRDKRVYRFLQDTRYGRRVITESSEIAELVDAVTKYVARRLVERERLLEGDSALIAQDAPTAAARRRRRRWRVLLAFMFGLIAGAATLFAIAWFVARQLGR